MLPDTHLDDSILQGAFRFPQYPAFNTKDAKSSTMPDKLRHRVRGLSLFADRGLPSGLETYRRSRNASEPQLAFSVNCMRGPWFTNFASQTVGDIAGLSNDDTSANIRSSRNVSAIYETPVVCSFANDDLQKAPRTNAEDSYDTSRQLEAVDSKSEASLYSMDSADQDAHPLLLSMPIIPLIKLERKATVRQPDPAPFSSATLNQFFLSPRIPDLRTPARMSSRRYGRILAGPNAPEVTSSAPLIKSYSQGAITPKQFGLTNLCNLAEDRTTEVTRKRPASEPTLKSPYTLNDEIKPCMERGINGCDSPHSDLLLSTMDEVGSSPGPCSDTPESHVNGAPSAKQVARQHAELGREQFSVIRSTLFGSIVHPTADGRASPDLPPKPKAKPKCMTERKPVPNAHDPTSKWAPKNGQIIIKVFVPSMDDIWMFRVPQDINLVEFTFKVVAKIGFTVSFSGSVWDEPKYCFRTDERFKLWVKGRIRFGRNLPIVAHVLAPLPLMKPAVSADGCEVGCRA